MPRLSRKQTMRRKKPRNMSKRRLNKKVSRRRVNRKKRNSLFGGALNQQQIVEKYQELEALVEGLNHETPGSIEGLTGNLIALEGQNPKLYKESVVSHRIKPENQFYIKLYKSMKLVSPHLILILTLSFWPLLKI